MNNGKVIVIEGACDGVGKTTQFKLLYERLIKDGFDIYHHHFPTYNTYQAVPIEKYLTGEFGNINELNPYFINSLYALDRGITWYTKLKKLYESGKILLFDRYTTSSLIYQSSTIQNIDERKKFIDFILDFEYNKIGIKSPDCVIFLYASFDLITKIRNARKENEGITSDIHERDLEFMKKTYENSLWVCEYLGFSKVKCDDINNMKPIEEIHEKVYSIVKNKI